ncbi:MAG TPA: class I SAM-dependent methyltransferase [Rhodocyclaceae bacterium]
MNTNPMLHWQENGIEHSARWRSEAGLPPPKRVIVADDTFTADDAYRLACEGTALIWRGDFQNGRQLLNALARRADKRKAKTGQTPVEAFHLHRQTQSQRARTLAMVLIPLAADYAIPLRRAPDWRLACSEAYGPAEANESVVSLRELLGINGAHEWRKNGVEISVLGERVHPWYGVFSPLRGEYLDLLAQAPLPSSTLAFDIGTGTGVIAALLAKRGVARIVATELDPRAISCARENLARLKFDQQVEVVEADLFPPGKAPLIVCNPPWVPARPSSAIEQAIYDPDSRMLKGFLQGLKEHLEPGGEGWLVLSDLAEHLGLRSRDELLDLIAAAGLKVLEKRDIRPRHPKASDENDPLFVARKAEVTSLWRLVAA